MCDPISKVISLTGGESWNSFSLGAATRLGVNNSNSRMMALYNTFRIPGSAYHGDQVCCAMDSTGISHRAVSNFCLLLVLVVGEHFQWLPLSVTFSICRHHGLIVSSCGHESIALYEFALLVVYLVGDNNNLEIGTW